MVYMTARVMFITFKAYKKSEVIEMREFELFNLVCNRNLRQIRLEILFCQLKEDFEEYCNKQHIPWDIDKFEEILNGVLLQMEYVFNKETNKLKENMEQDANR